MNTSIRRRRGEQGSAYLLTLLALVVLTVIALSLTLITQTEVQVAGNEKKVNRTFYASDSGPLISAAQHLSGGDRGIITKDDLEKHMRKEGQTTLVNHTVVGSAHVADRVRRSPMVPIQYGPCDAYCPVNDDGLPQVFKVNHASTGVAERIAWQGSSDPPAGTPALSHKKVSVMVLIEPWPTLIAVEYDTADIEF